MGIQHIRFPLETFLSALLRDSKTHTAASPRLHPVSEVDVSGFYVSGKIDALSPALLDSGLRRAYTTLQDQSQEATLEQFERDFSESSHAGDDTRARFMLPQCVSLGPSLHVSTGLP